MKILFLLIASMSLLVSGCDRRSCSPNTVFDAATPSMERSPSLERTKRTSGGSREVVDPYCGVRLRQSEAAATAEHRGRTYFFCLEDHRDAFLRDPDRFVRGDVDELDGDLSDADGASHDDAISP